MKTIRNLAIITIVAVTVYSVVKLVKNYSKVKPEAEAKKPAEDDFINSKNWN